MSEINKGPISYHHILKRRRVSLERWADAAGIATKEDFAASRKILEETGYFLDEAMLQFGDTLPAANSGSKDPVNTEPPEVVEASVSSDSMEEPKPKVRRTKVSSPT